MFLYSQVASVNQETGIEWALPIIRVLHVTTRDYVKMRLDISVRNTYDSIHVCEKRKIQTPIENH